MSTSLKRTGLRRYRLLVTLLLMVASGCVWATELAEGESDTWMWTATAGTAVTNLTAEGVPVTIDFAKVSENDNLPRWNATDKGVRFYSKNIVTFTAEEGYVVSGITINFTDRSAEYTKMTPTIGAFSATYPGKNEKSVGTWIGCAPHVTIANTSGLTAPIASIAVSYTKLTKVGETTVKSVGMATYCPVGQTVVVGDGTKTFIYTGVEANGTTLIEKALPVVPAGTGVMIQGVADTETIYNLYSSDALTATAPVTNLLVGVTEANTKVPANSYVLQKGSVGLAFYYVNESVNITLGPGKAYLKGDALGGGVKANLFFRGGEEPDPMGISTMTPDESPIEAIYNMQGIRQSAPQRGINIIRLSNGRTIKRIMP